MKPDRKMERRMKVHISTYLESFLRPYEWQVPSLVAAEEGNDVWK